MHPQLLCIRTTKTPLRGNTNNAPNTSLLLRKIEMKSQPHELITSHVTIPAHYHRVQTRAQQEASNFWEQQSTLSQINEQGKASYTPAMSKMW